MTFSAHNPHRQRPATPVSPMPGVNNAIEFAGNIMQRTVITVQRGSSLAEAASLMVQHGINALPVLDENGRVSGVIGIRDVLQAPMAHASPRPILRYDSLDDKARSLMVTPVDKVMRRAVVSVSEETSIIEVAAIMANRGVHPVLVLRDGLLVGVIGRADVARAMLQRVRVDRTERLAGPADPTLAGSSQRET